MLRIIASAVITILFFGLNVVAQSRPDAQEVERLAALVRTLSPQSLLRAGLVSGARGDGVRRAWMDDMRRQGVERAWIVVGIGLSQRPEDFRVRHATYYSGYDGGTSQITDPRWLERIRTSGLASTLEKVALERALEDSGDQRATTFVPIDLLEDEWLPPVTLASAQAHLKAISDQFKPKSDLRLILAHETGDGADTLWMSRLRGQNVRRAVVSLVIGFMDDGSPSNMHVKEIKYYERYDDNGSIISEPVRLEQIRSSGIEAMLSRLAIKCAAKGSWLDVPQPRPHPFLGGARVEFYDDAWLPFDPPSFFATGRPGK